MMRKHTILTLAASLMLAACGNPEKEQAEQLLNEARNYYEQGDLDAARLTIDSLRKAYPNIVEVRKQALTLHQDVELKKAEIELAKTDSLLQTANQELAAMQADVEAHKKALKATPEELSLLTRTRIRRDSIRTQFETLGAKIRYIHQKQK